MTPHYLKSLIRNNGEVKTLPLEAVPIEDSFNEENLMTAGTKGSSGSSA